jgi:MFS family permease
MSTTVEIQVSGTISEGTDPRGWLTLAVVVLASFIALLDATVDDGDVPQVQSNWGASHEAMQWVLAGYAPAFGLIIDGRLGDIFWRKRKFLFGVAGFRVRGRANWRATLRTPDNV